MTGRREGGARAGGAPAPAPGPAAPRMGLRAEGMGGTSDPEGPAWALGGFALPLQTPPRGGGAADPGLGLPAPRAPTGTQRRPQSSGRHSDPQSVGRFRTFYFFFFTLTTHPFISWLYHL